MKPSEMVELAKTYGIKSRIKADKKSIRLYIPKKKLTHRWVDWDSETGHFELFRAGIKNKMANITDFEDVIILARKIKK